MTQTTNSVVRNPIVATPYKGAYRQEPDEPENTPATQATEPTPVATPEPGPELSPEDRAYKTRYDSLKAHYDKTIVEMRKQVLDLKTQLEKTSRKENIPTNPEEFKSWKTQYPDLYRMILSAAREEVDEASKRLEEQMQNLEVLSRQARRDKAEAALTRLHPDFEELKNSPEFHNWVKDQPAQIQAWLYENEDDPLLASKAIDLYKAEKGVRSKPKKPDVSAAAQAVTKTAKSNDPEVPQGKIWKLSEIKRMTRRQFETNEAEIDKAREEGRIDFDI